MKKFYLLVVGMAAASLAVTGCVSISKYTPPASTEEQPVVKVGTTGKEQPKVKVEVELLERPDLSRFSAPKTPDNELTGNRGNFAGGVMTRRMTGEEKLQPVREGPKVWWSTIPQEAANAVTETVPQITEEKPAIKKYKVQKGQTLQDISKEVYGTTKNWKKIYEANKDKLKSPDKIYAGQVLDIPHEESRRILK